MGKKYLATMLALVLLGAGVVLASATIYLVQAEILPAVAAGSLSIRTDSMVLNRVWHGNEIYALLALYSILALAMAGTGIALLRREFSPRQAESKEKENT